LETLSKKECEVEFMRKLAPVVFVFLFILGLLGCDGDEIMEYVFDDNVVRAEDGDATIGGASTKLLDKTPERLHNIRLAIEAINGITIRPGEEFSFNDTVGERSEERGYKKATALFGREKVQEFGGGVCQVSTTIFQAAKQAGLEIEERHQHKRKIPYAELGQDATVDFDARFDLRFKNNTDNAIRMFVSMDEEHVHVTIDRL